jgi:hypothetical protein
MLFLFKKKVLHVDCFTSRQYVHDLYPIDYSHKFFPDWWKALPKSFSKEGNMAPIPTMKSCAGFLDFYKNGMTIPMWSDLLIGVDRNNGTFNWQYSDGVSGAMSHDFRQMSGYLDQRDFLHLKLHTPWLISCKENVNFSWIGNTWAFHNPHEIIVPPATLSYKYNTNTDINLFLHFTNPGNPLFIKQGTPLVNIVPQTERKLKIHLHKVSNEEYFNMRERLIPTSFLNKYKEQKKIIDRQEQEKPKCPFNWKK